MSKCTIFKELMIGMFYLTATIILIGGSYVVYQWQDLWSGGFNDFKNISAAIVDLNDTAKPISQIAPDVLTEMQGMNEKIGQMQISIKGMESDVYGINLSVYDMSHTVPNQMQHMEKGMKPWNMMRPFN